VPGWRLGELGAYQLRTNFEATWLAERPNDLGQRERSEAYAGWSEEGCDAVRRLAGC
jgi:hypothetical protein